MPAPNAQLFAQTAKLLFQSNALQLPVDWSQPNEQFPDAFAPGERQTAPAPPDSLFREPTLNQYHTDAAGTLNDEYADFIDGVTAALCDAVGQWMNMVMIAGAMITGPTCMVLPGNFTPVPILPFFMASAPMDTPQKMRFSNAIGQAFAMGWTAWSAGLMGTLMYPAFAAFPGPMAPPTPNVPLPLITFTSPGEAMMSPSSLSSQMMGLLGDPTAAFAQELFDAISQAWSTVFPMWRGSTMVTNVLGMGPIPTFAPPFVPVGPVMGGTTIPAPGVLS